MFQGGGPCLGRGVSLVWRAEFGDQTFQSFEQRSGSGMPKNGAWRFMTRIGTPENLISHFRESLT